MPNIYRPVFDEGERPPGFRSRRARIGYELGSELIGCSLWELPPGEAAYPYHFHFADEEVVIVVRGRPTVRTPEGLRELEEGEAVRFPLGETGAHQILNRGQETVTFLAVSSHGRPDVVIYPIPTSSAWGSGFPAAAGCAVSFIERMRSTTGTASRALTASS